MDGEAKALTRKCIDIALDDDADTKIRAVALKLCIERLIPPRKIVELEDKGLQRLSDDQLKIRFIELLGQLPDEKLRVRIIELLGPPPSHLRLDGAGD